MNIKEVVFLIAILLGAVAFCFGVGAFMVWATGKPACVETARAMGVKYHWGFWEGCLVQTPKGMYPLDQLREVR